MFIQNKTFLKTIAYVCFFVSISARAEGAKRRCLTGYMTDLQSWVSENGRLTVTANSIDVSEINNISFTIQRHLAHFRASSVKRVQYLSLAKCELNRVPQVFDLRDSHGRPLSKTVSYLSLYGNRFEDLSVPGRHYEVDMNATKATEFNFISFPTRSTQGMMLWSAEFLRTNFVDLIELDLRACSIQTLADGTFDRMPKLEMLYLGENMITNIEADAFRGLRSLVHLDISNNFHVVRDATPNFPTRTNPDIFRHLKKLISLDLSFSRLDPGSAVIFNQLGSKFERLSICETGIMKLNEGTFNRTRLKYLDVSGNNGILNDFKALQGVEDTLSILYADSVGLKTLDFLHGFENLRVLKASNNEVHAVTPTTAATWHELTILDLAINRIVSWLNMTFSLMPKLSFLSLSQNNINLITEHIIKDIRNVEFIGLSRNFIVCNCHAREFMDIAMKNELNRHNKPNYTELNEIINSTISFNTAFVDFEEIIINRDLVVPTCDQNDTCSFKNDEYNGNFLLFDFDLDAYKCLAFEEAIKIDFYSVPKCNQSTRDTNFEDPIMDQAVNLLMLLIIPAVILPVLLLGFIFRRWFVYFCITMRNSAMLSLINNGEIVDDGTIFNYDVFVSYCNEDRAWVLDHLLPHVEKDCNVSVCLHERDFQVGLSILENIVSCMDRSKSIMLVISQKFLMSQWCQFEMHLAQHRLLETRREDLILILLEKIPRHVRPNTLHYLMLTKTYIVWPKDKSERDTFWKRLNKSLIIQRIKHAGSNVSMA